MHDVLSVCPSGLLALLPVGLLATLILRGLGKRDGQCVINKAKVMQKSKQPKRAGGGH